MELKCTGDEMAAAFPLGQHASVDQAQPALQLAQFKSTKEKLHQLKQMMDHLEEGVCDDEGAHLLGSNQQPQVKQQEGKGQMKQNHKLKHNAQQQQQEENLIGNLAGVGGNDGVKSLAIGGEYEGVGAKQEATEGRPKQEFPTKMTQYGNTMAVQTLDAQRVPDHSHNYTAEDKSEPTSLNATTMANANVEGATAFSAGGDDGGGGGGGGDGGLEGQSHHDYKGPRIWRILVQYWPFISQPLALAAVCIGLWIIAFVLLPDYARPHTAIMRIFFLFVGAQLSGVLVTFICLPDMLGMLFFGVLYTNVGLANFAGYEKFEAFLREMALINIMLLAGLGLDANAFKKLWLMILRLTLIPTIAEVAVIALIARYTLAMPWFWGILLGLVVTAVSPNVVVTVMLKLKEERLGLNSGIHTLIYAMTSCNDVVAIFLFGVIMSVIFSTDKSLTQQILQGPIGIGIGIVFGYVYGLMLTILPSTKTLYLNGLRFVLTILGGTISVMGSRAIGYPSAGALGCMTIAFFAGIGWKRQQRQLTAQQRQSQLDNEISSVPARLDLLWKFLKPVSFSLIGKEINFAVLDGRVVGYGALLVLLGSLFRLAFAYLSTYGGNLTQKERAYITISGFPKATVQAALGPLALDMARSLSVADEQSIALANNVLIISVLAIIFTAPLGAVLMLRLAPIWLQRSDANDGNNADDDVYKSNNSNNGDGSNGDLKNASKKSPQSLSHISSNIQNNSSSRSLNAIAAADASNVGGADVSIHVDTTPPLPQAREDTKQSHNLV
ncbi:sodium/hydrogen exchanger 9B2 isoform X1 [Anastrepha ludens]|uniref:sodium/hydrogen exchanger 9B2 isoform X1 n=2 Tax=Anastrepha ludens TaxID=28586 RepID=UPI0023B173E7|nr:sodium/hydrogen exchanger 9B2 isoform X1 [Anastrepha ludens]XP_053947041.1 sodium/hydrogen exchanger 9B2 isoform X1 [Anastrepha ludens]